MSLDVYLDGEPQEHICYCPTCGNGHTRQDREHFYSANITHNLNKMADKAGIYKALWYPEELGITKAIDLVPVLNKGLSALKSNPDIFKALNPSNGWGDYDGLVKFVEDYIVACVDNPNANVTVSR